jgi:hypothetical protein
MHAVQVPGVHRPSQDFELLQFVVDGGRAHDFDVPAMDHACSLKSTVAAAACSEAHLPPAASLLPGSRDQAVVHSEPAPVVIELPSPVVIELPSPVVIELPSPPGPDLVVAQLNSSALLAPARGLVPLGLAAVAHLSPLIPAHDTSAPAGGPDPFGRVRTVGPHSGGFPLGVESALSGSAQLAAGVVESEFWVCVLCDGASSLAHALAKDSKTRKRGTNLQGRRESSKERTASLCQQARVTGTMPARCDGRKPREPLYSISKLVS